MSFGDERMEFLFLGHVAAVNDKAGMDEARQRWMCRAFELVATCVGEEDNQS